MNCKCVGAALLALATAAGTVRAADPPADSQYKPSWLKRNLGIGPDAPQQPREPKRDPAAEAVAARATAEETLDRRQRVCDELRRIAADTNNNELFTKAEKLEQLAFEVYKQQTAHLPCARLVPGGADERKLDRHLAASPSATAAADRLNASKSTDSSKTSQANAFREVKP
jgi:hypothetical protein